MKKRTITKTIKIKNLKKNYNFSGVVYTYPYGYEPTTTIENYTFDIENRKQSNMLSNDIDKKIKNIRIVYEFEQEILDDKEKEYLSSVIKPFKSEVVAIKKNEGENNREYIEIDLGGDDILFPYFKKGTMYRGMEVDKEYTLEELGL